MFVFGVLCGLVGSIPLSLLALSVFVRIAPDDLREELARDGARYLRRNQKRKVDG